MQTDKCRLLFYLYINNLEENFNSSWFYIILMQIVSKCYTGNIEGVNGGAQISLFCYFPYSEIPIVIQHISHISTFFIPCIPHPKSVPPFNINSQLDIDIYMI